MRSVECLASASVVGGIVGRLDDSDGVEARWANLRDRSTARRSDISMDGSEYKA